MKEVFKELRDKDKKLFSLILLNLLVKPQTLKEMWNVSRKKKMKNTHELKYYNKLSVLLNKMFEKKLLKRVDKDKIGKRAKGQYYTGRWDINENILIFKSVMKDDFFDQFSARGEGSFLEEVRRNINKLIGIIREVYNSKNHDLLLEQLKTYDFPTVIAVFNSYLAQIFLTNKIISEIAEKNYQEYRLRGKKTVIEEYKDEITGEKAKKLFEAEISKHNLSLIRKQKIVDCLARYYSKRNLLKNKHHPRTIILKKGELYTKYAKSSHSKAYLGSMDLQIPHMLNRLILCYNSIIAEYYYEINNIEFPEVAPKMFGGF